MDPGSESDGSVGGNRMDPWGRSDGSAGLMNPRIAIGLFSAVFEKI